MVTLLLKKQLMEIFRGFFFDRKKNRRRSLLATSLYFLGFGVLMAGVLGGMFAVLSLSMAGPLAALNLGWLYFAILSLLGLFLGVFGSVFNTYSSLYLAKDNDLLLSMPIPTRALIVSRLLGVYLMGLLYSAVVMVPAAIVWWIVAGGTARNVLGALLLALLVSVIVLMLSCLLGWVVARVSLRLKNRSYVVVLLSLAFFALYYLLYFRAQSLLQALIENALVYGAAVRRAAYPLYLLGSVGVGDLPAAVIVTAAIAVLAVLTGRLLSKSFLGIATASPAAAKRAYREVPIRRRSLHRALLTKELRRFVSSPNYMLNCGLGTLLLPVAGVLLLWRGADVRALIDELPGGLSGSAAALVCSALCMAASMNDMAVPSVSLEGKGLWLLQSLPVPPWEALKAKLAVQLWLTAAPTLFGALCAALVLSAGAMETAMLLVVSLLFVLLLAALGLALGTLRADLHWTNETAPIKQSVAVMLTLLLGWVLALIPGGGYLLLSGQISLPVWLALVAAAYGLAAALLLVWLKTDGARRFAALR